MTARTHTRTFTRPRSLYALSAAVLGLSLALTACGGDSDNDASASPTETATSTTQEPEATESTTEEAASGGDEKADCDFLATELNEIQADINAGMNEIQAGTNEPKAVLDPVVERLNKAVDTVKSQKVKEPLQGFAKEVEETFNLIADLDYEAIQSGDADAVKKAQEITPQIMEKQQSLPEAGGKIDTVCKSVS